MSDKPARYWRADGGYQDVPEEQQAMYSWQCWPTFSPWACQQYQQQAWCQPYAPQNWVNGPIPIAGLCSPPPAYEQLSPPPPPPPAPAKEENKEKKDDKKKDKKDPNAPPDLPEGAGYMYDKHHTMVHIFNKAAPIWEDRYREEKLKFKMFKTSVNFTVKMIIENVTQKEGDDCKGFAVTEAVERGGGAWAQGSTIRYDSDKSDGKLKNMGWSTKRGDVLPPVWLVVHNIDFKND